MPLPLLTGMGMEQAGLFLGMPLAGLLMVVGACPMASSGEGEKDLTALLTHRTFVLP